ncbi:rhodanese-related sulfurtransferase [Qipengyuania psychrotolerans]|uniref:tRNA uridine(34) hydroxylase n=1 Tax=Qipengyuania psychrotolerans TaxID=2867238 RepID=A0ABX8ZB24_9SPHN|nr:rhodanese-related sulfurtransferase [Qipengyuania psychrotolerans]QZD86168.1 rhodanese-related sulfurtransferase [Qipengyuania psychrotolerans]
MSEALPITVAALYRFAAFADPASMREPLFAKCEELGIKGTLLLAREGLNGTIAGTDNAIGAIIDHLRALPDCADLEVKYSYAAKMPFIRLKVRVKQEIVTMGEPDIDPRASVGRYVSPEDWNALIADPDTVVIDTRNDYETAIGTFEGAVDPHTASFRDFPAWFREHRDDLLEGRKKVAMFCTGGIRCEKSTSFLRAEGVDEVYHLKGGILKYLETVPEEESRWQGECFVFDERVAVGHGLKQGDYTLCRACRMPLDADDRQSPDFAEGVSCPHCIGDRDEAQRARYAERQKQVELARKRGVGHVGVKPPGR